MRQKPDLPIPLPPRPLVHEASGLMQDLAVPGCPAAGHMVPDRRVHMSQHQPATCCMSSASQNRKAWPSPVTAARASHCPCPWAPSPPYSPSPVPCSSAGGAEGSAPRHLVSPGLVTNGNCFCSQGLEIIKEAPASHWLPCKEKVSLWLGKRALFPEPFHLLPSTSHSPCKPWQGEGLGPQLLTPGLALG